MCRGPASFEPTEAKLKELGADFRFYATDATDRESVAKSFTQVQAELGTVEVLVYNCGGGGFGIPVLEIDQEEFVRSFEASCLGALLCAQQVRRTIPNRDKAYFDMHLASGNRGGAGGAAHLPSLRPSLSLRE